MSDETTPNEQGDTPEAKRPLPETPAGAGAAPEAVPAPEAQPAEEPPIASVPVAPPPSPEPAAVSPAPEPRPVPPPPQMPYAPPPPPYAPPAEVMPQRPGPATESSKILAALSYIFGIIAIVVLFVEPYKDEKFVRFHAIQALGLWVVGFVLGIFSQIPILGWFAGAIGGILLFVAVIVGAVKSFQGQYWEVPLVYDLVKSFIER